MSGTYESMEGEIGSLFETTLSTAEKLLPAELEIPFGDAENVSAKDRSSSISTMTKVDTESSPSQELENSNILSWR